MSMISAQIDELRKAAEYYDGSEVAAIMRYAADTIWQLRDDLQRANDENAELRERIHELEMEGSDHFYRTAYAEDANRTLGAENAKLRELIADVHESLCADKAGMFHKLILASMEDDMRELGVEVDG